MKKRERVCTKPGRRRGHVALPGSSKPKKLHSFQKENVRPRRLRPPYGLGSNRLKILQYEMGARRWRKARNFASLPTNKRGERRSMPFTIISPAASGGIRSAFFAMALRFATSSGGMPFGTRALSAIEVATPPG